jgi:hypothetical protein
MQHGRIIVTFGLKHPLTFDRNNRDDFLKTNIWSQRGGQFDDQSGQISVFSKHTFLGDMAQF